MISPKYATTHYFYSATELSGSKVSPNIVNVYLDYNCPFSAKIFFKLKETVIPSLQSKHPNKFQFVFVNVVQPWHPNSVYLHEFSLVVANLLREFKDEVNTNKLFWEVSDVLFKNKEEFYDSANADLNRNDIYKQIASLPGIESLKLPFSKDAILEQLLIKVQKEKGKQSNGGNGATNDIKYFTKYLRGVGVHVTPTVSINGIVNNDVSSGNEPESLVKTFEDALA